MSIRVLPYVYRLTHKDNGQFYIGYRSANKLRSEIDIEIYQTSSDKIKLIGFDNFNWEILAEFYDGDHAYDFEQDLIRLNFDNPLCLNDNFVLNNNGVRFKTPKSLSKETKEKISKSHIGKKVSDETRLKQSKAASKTRRSCSEETKIKLSRINMGHKVSQELIEKLRIIGKNSKNVSKVHICPYCGKEGKSMVMFRFHFDKCKSKT